MPPSRAEPAAEAAPVVLAHGLVVDRAADEVRFAAIVALRAGWLEQLVCTPSTREHETIFVTTVTPSLIHAALLLLDLEPGAPGAWRLEGDAIVDVAPTGPALAAFVRFASFDGALPDVVEGDSDAADEIPQAPGGSPEWRPGATVPITSLVYDTATRRAIDAPHFVFAGSLIDDREHLRPDIPRYVADRSGSVIGLVTFGDEVIALPKVRPDQIDVAPAEWLAWTPRIPPLGTEVTIVLRPIR